MLSYHRKKSKSFTSGKQASLYGKSFVRPGSGFENQIDGKNSHISVEQTRM
jgi:hypothetical protein